MSFAAAYNNRTVLVTGHTGFKGSWLCEWLLMEGARVVGYSLEPPTVPSHFACTGLGARIQADIRGNVRDSDGLAQAVAEHRPDFVFHLAAQPIVRRSFEEPIETVETNVLGTMNVLEAIRKSGRGCVGVMITTDKVYENVESSHYYKETDPLGGFDPYSASKACVEILIASYYRSFFRDGVLANVPPLVGIASARAGNVIGGGDWGRDRIVPDCMRRLANGETIPVRNKASIRPWQHVLEPLGGYLLLGSLIDAELHARKTSPGRIDRLCSPFNFGPAPESAKTVIGLVTGILKHWEGGWTDASDPYAPHEAGLLNLSIEKAGEILRWKPVWDFETTVRKTVEWYRAYYTTPGDSSRILGLTRSQIREYRAASGARQNPFFSSPYQECLDLSPSTR